MCITESWLHSNISDHELNIQGYNLVRRDRTTKKGGGIIAYIRSDIYFEEISIADIGETGGPPIETLWIKIIQKCTRPILVCVLYKPPKCTTTKALSDLGNQMKQTRPISEHELYMIGDMNTDMLKKIQQTSKKLNGSASTTAWSKS